jgi:hypothetical protein
MMDKERIRIQQPELHPRICFLKGKAKQLSSTTCIIMMIFSVIGFVTQVSYVSSQYFRYSTTTTVRFDFHESLFNKSVSVCCRIADVIDYDKVRKEAGINLTMIRNIEDSFKMANSITVKQLFDFTPDENNVSIIRNCVYRPNRWQVIEASSEECSSVFGISRFYTMENICYQFREKTPRGVTDVIVDHSPLYRARYNQISLTSLFDRVDVLSIIVSDDPHLPYRSRDYSYPLPHFQSSVPGGKPEYNFVFATSTYLYVNLLPPPHDTRCLNREDESMFVCIKNCLLEKYVSLKAIPATELWSKRYEKKAFIASNETDNRTLSFLTQVHDTCRDECVFTPCNMKVSKTVATATKEKTGSTFGFTTMTANDPDTIVNASATMTFIDYLSFIGSCFGTWFGVSFLSLNPKTLFMRSKKRSKQVNQSQGAVRSKLLSRYGIDICVSKH